MARPHLGRVKVRAHTLAPLGKRATEALLAARIEPDVPRPRTRADCRDGPRPCPWVACSHHLFLDVSPRGSIKLNFPHLQPWELAETCALDVAERDGATLKDVALVMNLTRERARQIETKALVALTPTLRAVVGDAVRPAHKETIMETTAEPTPATATLTEATASFDSTKETLRLAEMRLIVVQREVAEAREAHARARATVIRMLGLTDARRPNGATPPAPKANAKPGQRRGRGELRAAVVALAEKRNSVTTATVAEALGCTPENASMALSQATAAGVLRRVKRGVYAAT